MAERRGARRFERLPDPPLNLTERDMKVLALLATCRFVDTRQFQRLLGKRVERRLTRLYRHGYVERPHVQRVWRKLEAGGTRPMVYALTNKGAAVIGEEGRNWDELNRRLSRFSFSIPHTLLTTDVVVAVLAVAPDTEVVPAADAILRETGEGSVQPDALLLVDDVALFVEADRATEPISRTAKNSLQSLRRKFAGYHAALRAREHEQRWGVRRARVLVVTSGGDRRAANIARAVGEGGRILTTTREQLVEAENPLSAPIWITPDGGKVALFPSGDAQRR